MKVVLFLFALICALQSILTEEVRLIDLEPTDAQQVIEKQDQSLHYAPKIESNVPAIRFLGNEPHHVQEDIYLARQYHGQDGIGGYLYGYNVPDIAKTERKKAGGDLRGAYNYISGGQEIKVEYWDDGHGFHQIDNVPKILPKQIDDLPEVKAEKEKFLARWHEEAERNTHPVVDPYNSEGQYASGPLSAQGQLEFKKQFQQPGLYNQAGQYQQPGQYQTGQYQQPGQYQTGQYQQPGQYQTGQYQQPGQYQTGQYQQPGQQFGKQPGQYTSAENQIDYTGQYSETKNVYSKPSGQYEQPQQGQYQSLQQGQSGTYQKTALKTDDQIDNSGQYIPRPEDEDTTGPPKGFFYSFDYPVGIIVNKGELAKREGVKEVYDENKAKFEAQLQSGRTDGSNQSGYLYVKN